MLKRSSKGNIVPHKTYQNKHNTYHQRKCLISLFFVAMLTLEYSWVLRVYLHWRTRCYLLKRRIAIFQTTLQSFVYTLRKKGSTSNHFVLSGEPCHFLGFYEPKQVLYYVLQPCFGSLENLFQLFVEPLRVLLRGQLQNPFRTLFSQSEGVKCLCLFIRPIFQNTDPCIFVFLQIFYFISNQLIKIQFIPVLCIYIINGTTMISTSLTYNQ